MEDGDVPALRGDVDERRPLLNQRRDIVAEVAAQGLAQPLRDLPLTRGRVYLGQGLVGDEEHTDHCAVAVADRGHAGPELGAAAARQHWVDDPRRGRILGADCQHEEAQDAARERLAEDGRIRLPQGFVDRRVEKGLGAVVQHRHAAVGVHGNDRRGRGANQGLYQAAL